MNWFKSFWKKLAPPASAQKPAEPFKHNFTPLAQQMLALARREAERFNHNFVGTEHLLLGIIKLGDGVSITVLTNHGLAPETACQEIENFIGKGPEMKLTGNIPYTPRVRKVLALAMLEAKALNHPRIGPEHILLGLLREGDGVAARIMRKQNIDFQTARNEIMKDFGQIPPSAAAPQQPPQKPPDNPPG
jgi:ATP-dependent Clp protease ATP-binding subunit ClpC